HLGARVEEARLLFLHRRQAPLSQRPVLEPLDLSRAYCRPVLVLVLRPNHKNRKLASPPSLRLVVGLRLGLPQHLDLHPPSALPLPLVPLRHSGPPANPAQLLVQLPHLAPPPRSARPLRQRLVPHLRLVLLSQPRIHPLMHLPQNLADSLLLLLN